MKFAVVEEIKKSLYVFDFDDTLVRTDSIIYVKHKDGSTSELTPKDYASYQEQPGDEFDFTDFRSGNLKNPRPIRYVFNIFKKAYKKGTSDLVILTARADDSSIKKFLHMNGIDPDRIQIVPLGESAAEAKSNWVANQINQKGYTHVEYIDDAPKYLKVMHDLKDKYPNVKFRIRQTQEHWA